MKKIHIISIVVLICSFYLIGCAGILSNTLESDGANTSDIYVFITSDLKKLYVSVPTDTTSIKLCFSKTCKDTDKKEFSDFKLTKNRNIFDISSKESLKYFSIERLSQDGSTLTRKIQLVQEEKSQCLDFKGGNVDSNICEIEQFMIKQLNEFRAAHSLPTVKNNMALSYVARLHSKDQANRGTIGHWGYHENARTVALRSLDSNKLSDSSLVSAITPENVAMNSVYSSSSNEELAKAFTTMWKNSTEGHRENMLNNYSSFVGIGVVKSGNYYYATQIFGK